MNLKIDGNNMSIIRYYDKNDNNLTKDGYKKKYINIRRKKERINEKKKIPLSIEKFFLSLISSDAR